MTLPTAYVLFNMHIYTARVHDHALIIFDTAIGDPECSKRSEEVQLDNCGRENKNKFVWGIYALFVTKGMFKKVSFLHSYYKRRQYCRISMQCRYIIMAV